MVGSMPLSLTCASRRVNLAYILVVVEDISPIVIPVVKYGVSRIQLKNMEGIVANFPKERWIINFLFYIILVNYIFKVAKV
jgi:hypothetical protein